MQSVYQQPQPLQYPIHPDRQQQQEQEETEPQQNPPSFYNLLDDLSPEPVTVPPSIDFPDSLGSVSIYSALNATSVGLQGDAGPSDSSESNSKSPPSDPAVRRISVPAPDSSSAPAPSKPKRRIRRRQNVSCDQCRASKRGCDFQLRSHDAHDTRLVKGGESEACSNCQRRGLECTTNFADSMKLNKKEAQTPYGESGRERQKTGPIRGVGGDCAGSPSCGVLASDRSNATDSPPGNTSDGSNGLTQFQSSDGRRNSGLPSNLSYISVSEQLARSLDSLSLTSNRMRLYVSTVEPAVGLWMSKACSPLRGYSDQLGAIQGAIGPAAIASSRRLWASWHVDSPLLGEEFQPNLFHLVYGLDHLGEQMGLWGENRIRFDPSTFARANGEFDLFHQNKPRRYTAKDAAIDEAVKAAMLAYACQFRLDEEDVGRDGGSSGARADQHAETHDRVSGAAWRKARNLLMQLAPRNSCRVVYGLFLFACTTPPVYAFSDPEQPHDPNAWDDAAEDASFAVATASRQLESFVSSCRDHLRFVGSMGKAASVNGVGSETATGGISAQQREMAQNLMGLAEALGWFGFLLDTVSSVTQRRKLAMDGDVLLERNDGLECLNPPMQSLSLDFFDTEGRGSKLAMIAPATSPSRDDPLIKADPDGGDQVSRMILDKFSQAKDMIPALLSNPHAISSVLPFAALMGSSTFGGSPSEKVKSADEATEQVILLGVALGTAVEVYIWRRIGNLQRFIEASIPSRPLGKKVIDAIAGILDGIKLFHNIFGSLISKGQAEFFRLGRHAKMTFGFLVVHIHLGVMHFIKIVRDYEILQADQGVRDPALLSTSQERRQVGREAAEGIATLASLVNMESARLAAASTPGNKGHAPWRHPYPILFADALRMASSNLNDAVWNEILACPRDEVAVQAALGYLDCCVEGLERLHHAVPALKSYSVGVDELRAAKEAAAYVALD
ncbi:hypothetical protein IE53DRAFT_384465 [Violaceomyces palustris]|uniref:Uncharacterized protein n=1 Tax=Violaceomyces palustris TaxID=1673888 RepID=A0ACD0P4L6_9BASI|nr:hypothetical protein IE53DRAFT_384465 [Violaceomyces palustris]